MLPDLCAARSGGPRLSKYACLLLAGLVLYSVAAIPAPGLAASPGTKPTSSRKARHEAIKRIPFDRLRPDVHQKLRDVTSRPSIYRRLPVHVIDSDRDLYVFLVRHPEIIINMWQLMGVTKVDIKRTGKYTFRAVDGAGTSGNVELIYGTGNLHVFYGEGSYEGPLIKNPVTGRCVLVLSSGYTETAEGRMHVTSRLDMFARVDNVAADLVAKTLSPFVCRTVDRNFTESARFVGEVSRAAEVKWPGMQRLIPRLKLVEPGVRQQFSTVAARVRENLTASGAVRISNAKGTNASEKPSVARAKVRSVRDSGRK